MTWNSQVTGSIQVRTAIALGIVFLMTNKPDAAGSAITIIVAVALGVAISVPALNRARQRSPLSGQAASGGA